MAKIKEIPIGDIRVDFFVRRVLDDDRVLYFAELYERENELVKPLPLIEVIPDTVTGKWVLLAGRHRLAALQLLDRQTVKVEVRNAGTPLENIAMAFSENFGGPKPPTKLDIEHTVRLMLERGARLKELRELLPMLPVSLVKDYMKVAHKAMMRAKVNAALTDVQEKGLTVAQAAEKHGLDEQDLKDAIGGVRKRSRAKTGVTAIQAKFTAERRGYSQRMARVFEQLVELKHDGGATDMEIEGVLDYVNKSLRDQQKILENWRGRLGQ